MLNCINYNYLFYLIFVLPCQIVQHFDCQINIFIFYNLFYIMQGLSEKEENQNVIKMPGHNLMTFVPQLDKFLPYLHSIIKIIFIKYL